MRYLIVSLAMLFAASAHAEGPHRIVLHLDEADPARQELVLNNASNINKYYQDKGEEAEIEIVSYGPGLTMLLPNSAPRRASPALHRISTTCRSAPAPTPCRRWKRKPASRLPSCRRPRWFRRV